MNRHNCWEFMKCGREAGGEKVDVSGLCPVAAKTSADGLNGGVNAGRICWVVANNGAKAEVKCSGGHCEDSCYTCEFRSKVKAEEGLLNICRSTGSLLENIPT